MADKLTPKQAAFVREYLVDRNGTQAAIRAGYSEKTANEQAARLLANVNIKEEMAKGEAKHAERCAVSVESLTDELNEAIDIAREQQDPNALRAAVMSKAKIHGLDVNIQDHRSSDRSMSPRRNLSDFYKEAGKNDGD